MSRSPLLVGAALLLFFAAVPPGLAQDYPRDQMTDGTNWAFKVQNALSDTSVDFNFDYSTFGIPEAPHSQAGDEPTRGLRLQANSESALATGVNAYPVGQSFSGKFVYQFDMWLNTNGPFPDGGGGSTQIGGGSIGFDPNASTYRSGATFQVSGEAGSSYDYRLYANDEYQNYETHEDPMVDPATATNDLYDPKMVDILPGPCENDECGGDNADGNSYVQAAFPGLEPPAKQQLDFPSDQFGATKNGAAAFQWMTVKFTVDTDAGTALVQMTSDTSGQTVDVGTFTYDNTYVDQTTIDTKILTSFAGNISLAYNDPFNSPATTPELMFGIFDNVMVTSEVSSVLAGDLNGDGSINFGDLAGFSLSLTDPAAYQEMYPGLYPDSCDTDFSGACNFGDLASFSALLTGAGGSAAASAVPEPSTAALLLLLALVVPAGRCRR